MQDYPGKFIVLEGADGSGKETQYKLLAERLKAVGYEVATFDFPRYDQPSSHFVTRYLNGDYGPASQVNPYTASLFYALDRYEAAPEIRKALAAGKIVLANRYAGSNMGHQGSKFSDETEQRGFFVWADSLEFSLLGIPRPDLNLFLRVPAETSFKLIAEKARRNYTDKARDQHEADINHLQKSVATYDLLCQLFPKDFVAIDCTAKGRLLSIPAINNLIWEAVQPLLPATPPHEGHQVIVQLSGPPPPPPAGPEVAVAIPRSTEVELKKVSFLAASTVEAAAGVITEIEQPWYQDKASRPYYTPPGLSAKLVKQYDSDMKRLAKLHQRLQDSLESYFKQEVGRQSGVDLHDLAYRATRPVIPMAALVSSVGLAGEQVALGRLASGLENSPNPELKAVARQLKSQVPVPKEAASTALESLIEQNGLSGNISSAGEPLKLLDYWPRSEFSLLADGIYPYTDLGRDEISDGVERWTYERKENALRAMVMDPGSRILDRVNYHWDVLSDRLAIAEVIRRGMVDGPQMQAATPRYGYEVPELIEEAGLENEFMECFDISLELFSHLQAAGKEEEAGYATLLGHKLRWQFSIDAKQLANQFTTVHDDLDYTLFLGALREKILEVHPILATALGQLPEQPSAPLQPTPSRKRRNRHRSRKPRR